MKKIDVHRMQENGLVTLRSGNTAVINMLYCGAEGLHFEGYTSVDRNNKLHLVWNEYGLFNLPRNEIYDIVSGHCFVETDVAENDKMKKAYDAIEKGIGGIAMREIKFRGTPGPWKVSDIYDGWKDCVSARSVDDDVIAVAKTGNKETAEADARLIAAAPELLEVCIKLVKFLSDEAYNQMTADEKRGKLFASAYHAVEKALEG